MQGFRLPVSLQLARGRLNFSPFDVGCASGLEFDG